MGTASNCPGVHDGCEGHTTADVVDLDERVMRDVHGATYFLGQRATDASKREEADSCRMEGEECVSRLDPSALDDLMLGV